MKVRVQYMAQLRTAAGRAEEEIELPPGSALVDLLQQLAAQHGDAATLHLLSEGGQLQPGLLVVVNGAAQSSRNAPTQPLRDNDTVMLMPPIAGG